MKGSTLMWMFIFCVFFLAVGSFGGYRYSKSQNAKLNVEYSATIDSLNKVNMGLLDSVNRLSSKQDEQEKIIYKYKTIRDTIKLRPLSDLSGTVEGLNIIAKEPIPPND